MSETLGWPALNKKRERDPGAPSQNATGSQKCASPRQKLFARLRPIGLASRLAEDSLHVHDDQNSAGAIVHFLATTAPAIAGRAFTALRQNGGGSALDSSTLPPVPPATGDELVVRS